jgi:pimeloyl-ACP methyl ester carboxylesterase
MALPGLVLVHGGARAGDCWDLTVAELAGSAPGLRVLAVDLQGRGSRPADLTAVRITDFVASAVADIEEAGLGDVVVVGHSMAGLVVPGIVAKLGAARVREMILLAGFIPPQGSSVVDTLRGPLAPLARSARWIQRSSIP